MTKEERKEQERFEKAHLYDVYDKEGYWSHLSSLGVIHYSTIDQLVAGKSVADIVEGLDVSASTVKSWMNDKLFTEEYVRVREASRTRTIAYKGKQEVEGG